MSLHKQVCVFCQAAPATTVDHVPPRCLFPAPRPDNLVTVPACEPCNRGWESDGEYLRAALLTSANLEHVPTAETVRKTVLRSLARPESQGFATHMRTSFIEIEYESPGGIYLGRGHAFKMDIARVRNALRHIIRGLFFHETGHPLPYDHRVDASIDQWGDTVKSHLRLMFKGRPKAKINRIGSVFEYSVIAPIDVPTSFWLATFYQRVWMFGIVRPITTQ